MTSFNLHVSVTEPYILVGDPGNCNSCPIARALEDTAKNQGIITLPFPLVYVDARRAVLCASRSGTKLVADMPEAGRDFIRDFDDGCPVEPIELDFRFEG